MFRFSRPTPVLIACLLTALSSGAHAQASKSEKRTCRILFLAPPPDAPQTLFLFDGSKVQEVEPGRMSFSPVYEIAPGDITLALLAARPTPAGESVPPVIPAAAPKAMVAAAIVDFYLLLASDPANPVAPVAIRLIDARADGFRNGRMLWFNLTENQVAGTLGSSTLRIAPNSRAMLDAPANGPEDYPVKIQFLAPGKQEPEPLCETRWIHDPNSRSVFFIIKPDAGLVPRIIGVPDFRVESKDDS